MIKDIDNVGIAVSDLNKSIRFYEQLGFTVRTRDEFSAFLIAGRAALYLFKTNNITIMKRSFDLEENPLGIDHLSLSVEDVDKFCQELEGKGVKLERQPKDYEWSARAACLRDPDGNCIWLIKWHK